VAAAFTFLARVRLPGGSKSLAFSFGCFGGVLKVVVIAGASISASGCETDTFKVEEEVEDVSGIL
jgi:hypothetical protein